MVFKCRSLWILQRKPRLLLTVVLPMMVNHHLKCFIKVEWEILIEVGAKEGLLVVLGHSVKFVAKWDIWLEGAIIGMNLPMMILVLVIESFNHSRCIQWFMPQVHIHMLPICVIIRVLDQGISHNAWKLIIIQGLLGKQYHKQIWFVAQHPQEWMSQLGILIVEQQLK